MSTIPDVQLTADDSLTIDLVCMFMVNHWENSEIVDDLETKKAISRTKMIMKKIEQGTSLTNGEFNSLIVFCGLFESDTRPAISFMDEPLRSQSRTYLRRVQALREKLDLALRTHSPC